MKKIYILHSLAVAVLGFIFLNLAFLLDYAYQSLIRLIISPLLTIDLFRATFWFPMGLHVSYVFLIAILARFIFKSNIHRIIKAAFLTVPLATVYVTIGIVTYDKPVITYILGTIFGAGTLVYLLRTKRHWLYIFAWALISFMILYGALTGAEI